MGTDDMRLEVTADQVPFSIPDITDADIAAVVGVLRRGWLTSGQETARFEAELADYLGHPCVAFSSCTAALETAFGYLDLAPGARVGVPTWTYAASALAAVRFGAVPVLLDVDPATLNVAPAALEAALAGGLDAVVLVHVGGVPVDRAAHELCAAAGVPVVEDQAHALGARDHRGLLAGQGSVAGCLSFYATKNLPSGEGGALVTDDPDLVKFARQYRLHGVTRDAWARRGPSVSPTYDLVVPGIKGNLSDILAALARTQLSRFDALQLRRAEVSARYHERLAQSAVAPLPAQPVDGSAHHLFIVALPAGADRPAVMAGLAQAGIGTTVHYPPLHRLTWFRRHAEIGPAGVAAAEALADRVLSLPIYPGLDQEAVDRVADALLEAVGAAAAEAGLPIT